MPAASDNIADDVDDEDVDIPIDDEEGESGLIAKSGANSAAPGRDEDDIISDNYDGFDSGNNRGASESVKDEISE